MPELPELQAHAERLTEEFGGRQLDGFRAISFTALKTATPRPDEAFGHPLVRVSRRGKYLLLEFEPCSFVVHLMQGGRLKPDDKKAAKPRGGLARWLFADDSALLLTEAGKEHRAGVWVVASDQLGAAVDAAPGTVEPFVGLGPDADTVSRDELATLLAATSMRLHGFLRDQRQLAGIGRRLANEICHRARLSPFANTAKLAPADVDALHEAIGACIAESLAYERSRADMSSSKERPGSVHHRAGEPCPVCGDPVRAVEYSSYTVNYCATCQTGGKVLADNTTSKFLK
jgi:formamidopyrimidine-DNA glycosylase